MTPKKYAELIRRYRDYGPDPRVREAYAAGLNGDQRNWRKWRPGTKRGAAFAAGRAIRIGRYTHGETV